ncbi:ribonuclease P protein component [Buchnera aphidicola]|uniref:Ribonuclease P protein component n=1 Tax=Buchnera aphidicola (Sarucallis kahawaluokalani) TaxID=1241878 RepID=A0A4D6YLK4_9GAMM|nr:ribonuclease P protein component [Buchnera aphidicola]QCI25825.1 ribonuclease P protein component [Buchnera aphidicola (Sarucallis kahawaluokalani)]
MNIYYRYNFKKNLRLLTTTDFKKVFNISKKNHHSIVIIFNIKNQFNYPRLGIIISKKVSKLSYQRNLIKRLVRESFRLSQHHLKKLDFIILIKPNILKLNRLEIKNFLNNLWIKYYL